ncbi:MAG: type IV toxin-antitoxin system AbiEi family antitoxin domain-containing protein [Armatimonadota bacterium]
MAGIHPSTMYKLRVQGHLEQVSRGVYHLADRQPISKLDIVTVAARIPRAIVCLVSALAFHEITTQIPHAVSMRC